MKLKFHWNKNSCEMLQICIPNFHGPFENHKPKILKFITKLYSINELVNKKSSTI
jgi:hypothetical protein